MYFFFVYPELFVCSDRNDRVALRHPILEFLHSTIAKTCEPHNSQNIDLRHIRPHQTHKITSAQCLFTTIISAKSPFQCRCSCARIQFPDDFNGEIHHVNARHRYYPLPLTILSFCRSHLNPFPFGAIDVSICPIPTLSVAIYRFHRSSGHAI